MNFILYVIFLVSVTLLGVYEAGGDSLNTFNMNQALDGMLTKDNFRPEDSTVFKSFDDMGKRTLRHGYTRFWSNYMYKFLDLVVIALFITTLVIHLRIIVLERGVDWTAQDSFVQLQEIVSLARVEIDLYAIMTFIAWMKLLEHLSIFEHISRLVVIFEFMIRELWDFMILLGVVVCAFGSAEYISLGTVRPESRTWFYSVLMVIGDVFDGQDFNDAARYDRVMGFLFGIGYITLVSLLLMNLIIAIMNSAYERAGDEFGKAHWARRQFEMILESESHPLGLFAHYYTAIVKAISCCCDAKAKGDYGDGHEMEGYADFEEFDLDDDSDDDNT